MRLDTCRASPQVVAAGGMASSGAREPVEDPASKVLITSSVADQKSYSNRGLRPLRAADYERADGVHPDNVGVRPSSNCHAGAGACVSVAAPYSSWLRR